MSAPATLAAAAAAAPVHTKEMKVVISERGKQGQRKEKPESSFPLEKNSPARAVYHPRGWHAGGKLCVKLIQPPAGITSSI